MQIGQIGAVGRLGLEHHYLVASRAFVFGGVPFTAAGISYDWRP